jgi:predicted PurR-regulated permease PerM
MTASNSLAGFAQRALVVLALAAGALLAWELRTVLLLFFATVIVALLLRALARPLTRRTGLPDRWAVAVTALLVALVIGGALVFFGWSIQAQLSDIADRLPGAWAALEAKLNRTSLGARLVHGIQGLLPGLDAGLLAKAAPYLKNAAGALGDVLLVVVGGVYLALDPGLYRRGFEALLPKKARRPAAETLDEVGGSLQSWLLAQGLGMLVVGLLTGIGLQLIGVPAAAALGLLTGIADFVPLIGPLIAGGLSVILAVPLGLDRAGWTLLLFVALQQLEGDVILPVLQKGIVSLPPVVTLFALIGFGVVFGPIGVLLAVPMTAALMVALRRLWLPRVSGEGEKG